MTVLSLLNQVSQMLGNSDTENPEFQERALTAVNKVYADMCFLKNKEFNELKSVNDIIDVDRRIFYDVMPYGVAAFMASASGDVENHNFYARLYNLKRKKNDISVFQDVIPTV